MKENELRDRVLTIIEEINKQKIKKGEKPLNRYSFEMKCSLSNGTINKLGDKTRSWTYERILESFPEINRTFLYYGELPVLKESSDEQGSVNIPDNLKTMITNKEKEINYLKELLRMKDEVIVMKDNIINNLKPKE